MSISSYTTRRYGRMTTVEVTSDLSGEVFYHWYVDGQYSATTRSPSRSFLLEPGDYARIICVDTVDPDFDPASEAPAGYPARRTIVWQRPDDADVRRYKVEQLKSGGSWATIGIVPHDDGAWEYSLSTPRLDDLGTYEWRITPVDGQGNEGTALSLDSEKIVRTPDAPDFDISFDDGTARVTFSSA